METSKRRKIEIIKGVSTIFVLLVLILAIVTFIAYQYWISRAKDEPSESKSIVEKILESEFYVNFILICLV